MADFSTSTSDVCVIAARVRRIQIKAALRSAKNGPNNVIVTTVTAQKPLLHKYYSHLQRSLIG